MLSSIKSETQSRVRVQVSDVVITLFTLPQHSHSEFLARETTNDIVSITMEDV